MDKCPKCHQHSLDYDPFKSIAICTHNGCGFRKKMTEDQYIVKYADLSKYVLLPQRIEKKVKQNRR